VKSNTERAIDPMAEGALVWQIVTGSVRDDDLSHAI